MTDKETVLITGATGFLGAELLKLFLLETDADIFLLIRVKDGADSLGRLKKLLRELFSDGASVKNYLRRITVFSGDLNSKGLGLSAPEHGKLVSQVTEIFHSAAALEFNLSYDSSHAINVKGFSSLLRISLDCKKLKKFSYISTVYIAGNYVGEFREDDFHIGQAFNNYYEQTKYEGEDFFRNFEAPYEKSIFRPSIITGNYDSGWTNNFNLIYKPMKIFSSRIFEAIPADRDVDLNLIPGNVAARIIYILSRSQGPNMNIYHVTSPKNIKAGVFYDYVADYFKYENPVFIPIREFDMNSLTVFQINIIKEYLPYFNYRCRFKNEKTVNAINAVSDFCFPRIDEFYFEKLCNYCKYVGFLKVKRS